MDFALTKVFAVSRGKKMTPGRTRPYLLVSGSTHQAELVLRRPSVCQQFGPGVHFQNVSSCSAEVEKAVIVSHLGGQKQKPEDPRLPSSIWSPN